MPSQKTSDHSTFYAHTREGHPPATWEPLYTPISQKDRAHPVDFSKAQQGEEFKKCHDMNPQHGHLNKVAYWTARFAKKLGIGQKDHHLLENWAYYTGLLHDLGKFSHEFQERLKKLSDPHCQETVERVNHSTTGAQVFNALFDKENNKILREEIRCLGILSAFIISGHHRGLHDTNGEGTCLEHRLFTEKVNLCSDAPKEILAIDHLRLPPWVIEKIVSNQGFALSFLVRFLFSCLVDADFLLTEKFMNPQQATLRNPSVKDLFPKMQACLQKKIDSFGQPKDDVAKQRSDVYQSCVKVASQETGFYSLSVPTGGGKTLSSLAFALQHAIENHLERIIYVIPFTSIVDQNAQVFRDLFDPLSKELGMEIVIEHHSSIEPDKETTTNRLSSENWDAPLVVTTAVQFYESLYAYRPSPCRKLHRTSNAVIILDEAQCLPIPYLSPCLEALKQLTQSYRSTVVLCTATQPALEKSDLFPIGLEGVREIIPDKKRLYQSLDRVTIENRGSLPWETLVKEIHAQDRVLCIVNTRKQCQELYQSLDSTGENHHLSALMYPEHRKRILERVRNTLKEDPQAKVRLIATPLIEAGVDIDFPVVYRAMAGLDSIAQAAGRCNREGKLKGKGTIHVFKLEDRPEETFLGEMMMAAEQAMGYYPEALMSLESIKFYFQKYYYDAKGKWDSKNILDAFTLIQGAKIPFRFQFETVAKAFSIIENDQVGIFIPREEKAEKLEQDLRNPYFIPTRDFLRKIQTYVVPISKYQFEKNKSRYECLHQQFWVSVNKKDYSDQTGLKIDYQAKDLVL